MATKPRHNPVASGQIPHRAAVSKLSLGARLSLIVAALLLLGAGITAVGIYELARRSLRDEGESQLNMRLMWLQAAIEADESKFEIESTQTPPDLNDQWQVALPDGRVLWSSRWSGAAEGFISKSKTMLLGEREAPQLVSRDIVDTGVNGPFGARYRIPPEHRSLKLSLTVRAFNDRAVSELNHLALSLATFGPLVVLALAGILAFFIKWQLRPLEQMSLEAATVGPENMAARIGPAGNSVECVRMRDAINSMIERLAQGLERERNFASIAAHELRTPVAQIRTTIEVALRKERSADDYRAALALSLLDAERMQKLIENLLFLTRNHHGLELEPSIPLSRVITEALGGLRSSLPVAMQLDGVSVRGHKELLVCAVRNVLENAARFAPGDAPEISAECKDQKILLRISDHGPGIPDADRERIFDPLTRLDQARSIGETADGFGLGLTVARAAARACGGDLTCSSRRDAKQGAEFVFHLNQPGN